jgi:hypothetical protein
MFFFQKNIQIANVAEKNILILVEEKKKSDSEILLYSLMLNSGKKNSERFVSENGLYYFFD